jgi:hypothetical protein
MEKISKKIQDAKKSGIASKATKVFSAIAPIAAIGSALSSGDVSAAVPVFGSTESLGPSKGSLDYKIERGDDLSEEEKQQLKERIKNSIKNRK